MKKNQAQASFWMYGKAFCIIIMLLLVASQALAESGDELYASGDYSGAIVLFKQELEQLKGPEQAPTLNNIGTCYTGLGDLSNATDYFKQAVVADPEYWRGWINLGVVQERSNQIDDAVSSYGKVPSDEQALFAEAQVKLGTLLATQTKNDEALAAFRLAEDGAVGPVKVDLYTGIGAIEFFKKNNQAAEEAFLKATEAGPDDAALAWTNLGVLRIAEGKYDEAKKMFETAIQHDPNGKTNAVDYLNKLQKIIEKEGQ